MNKIEKRLAERKTTVEKELQALIVRYNMLKHERDAARREVCELTASPVVPLEVAKKRGWNCFKENT